MHRLSGGRRRTPRRVSASIATSGADGRGAAWRRCGSGVMVLAEVAVLAPILYWGGVFGLAVWLLWVIARQWR